MNDDKEKSKQKQETVITRYTNARTLLSAVLKV